MTALTASRLRYALDAAFAFAEDYDPIEGDWLIDFLIDGFRDIVNRDARFPKLSDFEFELLIAGLRRHAEEKAEMHFEVAAANFRKIVIAETLNEFEENA